MGYIEDLTAELNTDPLVRNYASMSDGVATVDLNSVYRTMIKPLNTRQLLEWAAVDSRARRLGRGRNNPNDALAAICITAVTLMNRSDAELDLNNEAHVAAIDALVTGGILTPGDRDALVVLATVPVSRANELFGRNATFVDLATARGRP